MSWNNVSQVQVTSITATLATTASVGQFVRVQGFTYLTSGTGGGHIEFKENTGGKVRITEQVPTATNVWGFVRIPDDGVRFENGLFVSCAAGITLGVYLG